MGRQGNYSTPGKPAKRAPGAVTATNGDTPADEVIIETFSASDDVAPFVPAAQEVNAEAGVESAQGIEHDVEWAGTGKPDAIDSSTGGKEQI